MRHSSWAGDKGLRVRPSRRDHGKDELVRIDLEDDKRGTRPGVGFIQGSGRIFPEEDAVGRDAEAAKGIAFFFRFLFFTARRPTIPFFRYGLPPPLQRASRVCYFSPALRGEQPGTR
jgi:hypothetical protein